MCYHIHIKRIFFTNYNFYKKGENMALNAQNFITGEKIIDELNANKNMFILLEGEVEVYTVVKSKKISFGVLKATENEKPFFGEMAFLFNIKRTATVVCKTNVKVLLINNEEDLLNFFAKSPKFAIYCFKELSERLYTTTKKFLQNDDEIEYLKIQLSHRQRDNFYKI